MREEVAHLVHEVDAQLVILDRHVHVHAADDQAAADALHFLGEVLISLLFRRRLVEVVSERMRRGGNGGTSEVRRDLPDRAAQGGQMPARLPKRAAGWRAD